MQNCELVKLIKSRFPDFKIWDGYVPDMYGGVVVETPTAKFEVRDVGDDKVIVDYKKKTDPIALSQIAAFLTRYYGTVEKELV